MGKTALVTGAAGFVGRHMCSRLVQDGWQVTRVDVHDNVRAIDCRDVFRHDIGRYDLVVHLAAVVGGRQTIDTKPMKVAADLAIDSDFFQYVLRTKPVRAVYFSSSAAYPTTLQDGRTSVSLREDDIDLDHVSDPDAIYGWVKLTGERLAHHANEMGAGVYVFRPFSGYGEDQDLDYPFPSLALRARSQQRQFAVWGPGTQVRDWVHIDDVVDTVVQTLDWDPGVISPLNICTGIGTSFHDLAHKFMAAVGYEGEVVPEPTAPTGVMHRVGDPEKSHKIHKPQVTIEEGIARALGA